MNPLLLVDFYKPSHYFMYPEGMTKLYSNFTPRKSRISGVNEVVVFAIQHFSLEYLIKGFNDNFFKRNKQEIIEEYSRHVKQSTYSHIEALHDLQYLPIEIKALDEGTLCPIGVPMLTITNTHPQFGWLVNYLETLISCMLWQPITSATIAHEYKKLLTHYAKETDEKNVDFVQWQGHDFSMRGMSSAESAILSGMGHLLSFTGTDTIPAIKQMMDSYIPKDKYDDNYIIGASVPATEHSVMCMGTKESEIETFERLLDLYHDSSHLSVVSDTWNLWDVLTIYLPKLKEKILSRPGKLVIRPDSGDPVDIICGYNTLPSKDPKLINFSDLNENGLEGTGKRRFGYNKINESEWKGVIEILWDIFGGTVNEQGYKVLDPHIGAIYGDSITLERATQICERLKAKGFASTNIVLGIGSYTYQYNTRDTFGFAMKATYGEVLEEVLQNIHDPGPEIEPGVWKKQPIGREIFKDPITDDGTKKSRKGLLRVLQHSKEHGQMPNQIYCHDQCTWEEEKQGLLTTVFKDGKLTKITTLEEIRNKLNN